MNFLMATASLFYYTASPVVEMRDLPTKESEVVSQSYYSEEVKIVEETDNFVKIETLIDGYQGWIKKDALCQRTDPFLTNPSTIAKVNRCAAHLYGVQDTVYGPILTLPFDSRLEVIEQKNDPTSRWIKVLLVDGREGFIQRGDVTLNSKLLNRDQMCNLSLQFLGLPYTWGGRSSFGYDCSGFVQMLYRQIGIHLPRDSKDQMHFAGFRNVAFDALNSGDLIFFGLSEDKIRHVGMYLGNNLFIHATVAENLPFIRISCLTDAEWNGSGKFTYRTARKLICH